MGCLTASADEWTMSSTGDALIIQRIQHTANTNLETHLIQQGLSKVWGSLSVIKWAIISQRLSHALCCPTP